MAEKPADPVRNCPTWYAFRALEGKWKLPTIWMLSENGSMRYNDLKRQMGVTSVMLTDTLRELEASGLVTRTQYNEIPPRVEYALTPLGKQLIPALKELGRWGEALMAANGEKTS